VNLNLVPKAMTDPNVSPCSADVTDTGVGDAHRARRERTQRLYSAWITSLASKGFTLLVQLIAIPLVYRALGPGQFAAYAALASAISVMGVLNLGMGGALVTPLAQAAARNERSREARIVSSTLLPLMAIGAAAAAAALPALLLLPLPTLFGLAASATPGWELRTATIIAGMGTLTTLPLSAIESLRQAYQEVHLNNLFGAFANALICLGLLIVSWLSPTLPAFVAIVALGPPAVRVLNAALFFNSRRYLAPIHRSLCWRWTRQLAKDGSSYIGASTIGAALLYHWPVYLVARVRPPLESSTFAVFTQLIVLVLSFGMGFAQPLWGATADAVARSDRQWVDTAIRRARIVSLAYGISALMVFGLAANSILTLWLHRPFYLSREVWWLAGAYVLLAMWEFIHWPFTLGMGALRAVSEAQLGRSVLFAASVPLAILYGDLGLITALCASVIFTTAWYYPLLLARSRERLGLVGYCEPIRPYLT
jgi:O-antigen/teichoic acid export membrane protein